MPHQTRQERHRALVLMKEALAILDDRGPDMIGNTLSLAIENLELQLASSGQQPG